MKAKKFTRADIAQVIADTGIDRIQAAGVALSIVQAMADALIAGKVIELRGFGTLEPRKRKARTIHNPHTMAPVDVPARRVIFFQARSRTEKSDQRQRGNRAKCITQARLK